MHSMAWRGLVRNGWSGRPRLPSSPLNSPAPAAPDGSYSSFHNTLSTVSDQAVGMKMARRRARSDQPGPLVQTASNKASAV